MESQTIESSYPISFREEDAKKLGEQLQHQHSVELVGMKRVGISNFLRYFLFHTDIREHYMPQDGSHLFILVDLNDLIEREIFPFWRLTFKRIADTVEKSSVAEDAKKKISSLFLASIQSGDLFLTYDGIREALGLLSQEGMYPVLFLSRFDRLKDAVTPEFFDNLHGLKDATNRRLSYVFTSFRELDSLAPEVFAHKQLSLFAKSMYIKPASMEDSKIVFATFAQKYQIQLPEKLIEKIIVLTGGHVQYLQFALFVLHELGEKQIEEKEETLLDLISHDERIALQSEELWESLTEEEKTILLKCMDKKTVTPEEKETASYLWDSGFLTEKDTLFSPLFEDYVFQKQQVGQTDTSFIELSKKEHLLLELLKEKPNEITEREDIVEQVWPEYKEYGVSDWSIDRLVARLRGKLKQQKASFEIQTIRTRGYKLLTK